MKHARRGETLWSEWTGELYEKYDSCSTVFYTLEHVDVEEEVVRRALASAVQREGIADSLGEAFKLVENADVRYAFAGIISNEKEYTVCNDKGETFLGDVVEKAKPITIVEL